MTDSESLSNPIEEAFKHISKDFQISKELFIALPEELDLKTDLIYPEDVFISTLRFNDDFLVSKGLKEVYSPYIKNLLRLRFSLDRKSRVEFTQVNTRPSSSLNLNTPNFDSVKESRT